MKNKRINIQLRIKQDKALMESMKDTICFLSRGNIFLQVGKFKTAADIEKKMREKIQLDFSAL